MRAERMRAEHRCEVRACLRWHVWLPCSFISKAAKPLTDRHIMPRHAVWLQEGASMGYPGWQGSWGAPPIPCRPMGSLHVLQRYGDLGGLHLPIHTDNPVAQRLFNLVRTKTHPNVTCCC